MNQRRCKSLLAIVLVWLASFWRAARAQRAVTELSKDWKFIKQDADPAASTKQRELSRD